jgi:hypothetical protein
MFSTDVLAMLSEIAPLLMPMMQVAVIVAIGIVAMISVVATVVNVLFAR